MKISGLVLLRYLFGAVLVADLGLSLRLPAASTCGFDMTVDSVTALLLGPAGPVLGTAGWYANPLFAVLLLGFLARDRMTAIDLGTAAMMVVLALSSFRWTAITGDGVEYKLCGFGPGFYTWLAGVGVLAAAVTARWLLDRRAVHHPPRNIPSSNRAVAAVGAQAAP